jgi:hypothetical protein
MGEVLRLLLSHWHSSSCLLASMAFTRRNHIWQISRSGFLGQKYLGKAIVVTYVQLNKSQHFIYSSLSTLSCRCAVFRTHSSGIQSSRLIAKHCQRMYCTANVCKQTAWIPHEVSKVLIVVVNTDQVSGTPFHSIHVASNTSRPSHLENHVFQTTTDVLAMIYRYHPLPQHSTQPPPVPSTPSARFCHWCSSVSPLRTALPLSASYTPQLYLLANA